MSTRSSHNLVANHLKRPFFPLPHTIPAQGKIISQHANIYAVLTRQLTVSITPVKNQTSETALELKNNSDLVSL